MAETLVEKKVCGECGVDVRPQTQFCYNCGKSVTETPDADPAEEPSSIWFGETLISNEPEPEPEPEPEAELPAEAEPEPVEDPADAVTEAWEGPAFAEDIADPAADEPETAESAGEPAADAPEMDETGGSAAAADLDPIHHSLPVESGMRSAASIRRKPKTFQRREVEIVWEEYEGRSGLKYVLITLLVVLFTIVVFWIAMTMK